MKIQNFASTVVLGSLLAATGAAAAAPQNSTSGHIADRANFERSLEASPHPHAHALSKQTRTTGSTQAHARDRADFDAVLASPRLAQGEPFVNAAPTDTGGGLPDR